MSPEEALPIAQKWLDDSASTATNKQFDEHFNLISKKVRIKGIPGYDSVSYEDWARQSKQEFEDNVLKSVSYTGLKMIATNEYQMMFKTIESVEGNDGTKKTSGVEILLQIEDDKVWRVVQERVLTDDESRHDGLM